MSFLEKCKLLEISLNELSDWCDANGFKISVEKSVAVLFTHRREDINNVLKIKNSCIRVESEVKFLGLIFDSRLTWNDHVHYVVDKCKKRLNVIRAVAGNKWGASKKVLLMIYRGLIRSVFARDSIYALSIC